MPISNPNPSGVSAYSTVLTAFIQPAPGSDVLVQVNSSEWMAIGQSVFVEWGGLYRVADRPSAESVTLTNLPSDMNHPAGSEIALGAIVSPSGLSTSTFTVDWDAIVVAGDEVVTSGGNVVIQE